MKKIGWHLENSYQQLPQKFFTQLRPTPVDDPHLVMFNDTLAATLGFQTDDLKSNQGVNILAGNKMPDDASPIAQAYAGHQFGNFTMLGDGRAILIGEQLTSDGNRYDIQLKGAGQTPYSRGGDGRAALGPMLREYIISEAMHNLGIPTTRGLAVVTTGERVIREVDYAGAILTRVSASHLRVGTFQFAAAYGTKEELKALADYAIERHGLETHTYDNPYLNLLETVVKRQAHLIAQWQLVGFIHGVMNTDNMTISGETIDYGPCAFMDTYDLGTVFSSIDQEGRYDYGNQPNIGGWNLARFAEALLPLLHDDEDEAVTRAEEVLSNHPEWFQDAWLTGMRAKLGIFNKSTGDETLISDLLQLLQDTQSDYTNTFIALTKGDFTDTLFQTDAYLAWHDRWMERLKTQDASSSDVEQLMQRNNPVIIPRNHLVESALDAAVEKGDYSEAQQLLDVLADPYDYAKDLSKYQYVPERTIPYQTYCGT